MDANSLDALSAISSSPVMEVKIFSYRKRLVWSESNIRSRTVPSLWSAS